MLLQFLLFGIAYVCGHDRDQEHAFVPCFEDSKGLTGQYIDFNGLLTKYNDLQVLAFPCNQFGMQEPGHNDEIINGLRYVRPGHGYEPHERINFFAKLDVNGENEHQLFTKLKQYCPPPKQYIGERSRLFWDPIRVGDISWNFEKFLLDRQGQPRYRFSPDAWEKGALVEKYIRRLLNEN